ncbi:MAG: glycine--tRNA ligase subunit beta [Pseudomonadota bacterium]
MKKETLLIEIGTEELPPTTAKSLSDAFTTSIIEQLTASGISMDEVTPYVTPRRIAVVISNVTEKQSDHEVERKGPSVKAAYDADGNPTKAALGFAKSCGVDMQDLQTLDTDKGAWLYFKITEQGKSLTDLIPTIIEQALKKLPIPKPMRWGDYDVDFVRPIHWVIVMHGSQVIPCSIKNIQASNKTYGHRFHAPQEINLQHADDYSDELYKAKVIAGFKERRAAINTLLKYASEKHEGDLDFSDALLDEVTNLVEWPMAVVGDFDEKFLAIPQEVLVATMQDAQRYFPLYSKDKLIPKFIVVANIESTNPETVKHGNERVIKPRFEDAGFFWMRDRQNSLASRSDELKGILFEKQLGSIQEKTQRISALAEYLCKAMNLPSENSVRASYLCKNDLLSNMVNEFPKLQGIMGRYYAENDGEVDEVAIAIEEHYQPLQSGSKLPTTITGKIVAVCDRIDTLVGIFATGKKPTGVKDPYALRRAALSVIRISVEGQLDFDLLNLIKESAHLLQNKLDASASVDEVFDYILERLRGYFQDQGIPPDTFESVRSIRPTRLMDFAERIKAVEHFRTIPVSQSLAAANKRIHNILKKSQTNSESLDITLLKENAEKALYEQIIKTEALVDPKFSVRDYTGALSDLAKLKPEVDQFFDEVMVMDEDLAIRSNRIALLTKLNCLFSTAADISQLQS